MSDERSSNVLPILLAIGMFSALSIAAAKTSDGFLEGDACTHYMYARFAFQQPHFFINIWGRPICTAIYSIPAVLAGRTGTQFMCLLLAIGCGLIAFRIALKQNYRWPALALIFTLAQPLVFLHSFNEMTELPFALLLGLGFLAYQSRQWVIFALLLGFTPLSRPEGFGFVILAAVALILHRRARWLILLVLPLILWEYAGWRMYGRTGHWWRWLIDNWPYSSVSAYAPGSPFYFLGLMPVVISPLIFPAACLGVWLCLRSRKPFSVLDVDALTALIPLSILVGHSVLYATGRMASNGEPRYMLTVAPFWALLSARGWEWIFTKMNWRWPLRLAGMAAILPIAANSFYRVLPLKLDDDWVQARVAANWYESSTYAKDYPKLATAHPAIHYFIGTSTTDRDHSLDWRRDILANPPAGAIIIWDPMYPRFNSDKARTVELPDIQRAGWIDVTDQVPPIGKEWHVFLSPHDIHYEPRMNTDKHG